jgi:hypothetical protein
MHSAVLMHQFWEPPVKVKSALPATVVVALLCAPLPAPAADDYDVVIAGGSTAAFAAAVASAEMGARTCLIEPTDWVGGQLTSSGVPAVDQAWHRVIDPATKKVTVDVASIARQRENMTPNFRAMLDAIGPHGGAWVSNYCFEPKVFIDTQLAPLERRLDRLIVLRNSVMKQVEFDAKSQRIRAITVIQRIPAHGVPWDGYDQLPSHDLPDWYRRKPSDRFDKRVITIDGHGLTDRHTVFIDATEWGELLALSGAPYLQGVESVDGGFEGNDRCGQATVFGFVERFSADPVDEPPVPTGPTDLGFGDYAPKPNAWELIWTYRRIKNSGQKPAAGDLSLQNWEYSEQLKQGGNDYPFGYLFKSMDTTLRERSDWHGGIDLEVMAAAERRALAWHSWFKEHAPPGISAKQIVLARGVLGTGHGLAKLPYIRDTRRSVGLGGFLLTISDLTGFPSRRTGKPFRDRIAIGAYAADIHPLVTCEYPAYVRQRHETLPFYIPFRALTNRAYGNLLVAGKTMAQSFMANSATRLHPIEWASGTAAGIAAALMARRNWTSTEALEHISELQAAIAPKTPIDWTIEGAKYPLTGETAYP